MKCPHCQQEICAEATQEDDVDGAKAIILLRQARDDWYRLTGYSQLKVDIDELLQRVDERATSPQEDT